MHSCLAIAMVVDSTNGCVRFFAWQKKRDGQTRRRRLFLDGDAFTLYCSLPEKTQECFEEVASCLLFNVSREEHLEAEHKSGDEQKSPEEKYLRKKIC